MQPLPAWVAIVVAIVGALGNVIQFVLNARRGAADTDKVRADIELGFLQEAMEMRRALRDEQEQAQARVRQENEALRQQVSDLAARLQLHDSERQQWQSERVELQLRQTALEDEIRVWQHGSNCGRG